MTVAVAILRRRLRQGKTYEDFRRAWFHEEGFNAPNRMFTMLNIADPREVIVIGVTDVDSPHDGARLLGVDQGVRSASPLDDVIEPEIQRTFGILVAEDDFSAAGTISYRPREVGGHATDLAETEDAIATAQHLLAHYLPRPE